MDAQPISVSQSLHQVGTLRWPGRENLWLDPGGLFILGGKRDGDLRRLARFSERNRGPAETTTGHAGTDHTAIAADLAGDVDHDVEFFAGDFEVVAQ